jgi:hypothetical protein
VAAAVRLTLLCLRFERHAGAGGEVGCTPTGALIVTGRKE